MAHVLLLDMAIHTFDAARLLSGANAEAVYCLEWNPPGSWYKQDAAAIAVFEMSDGIVYSYRGSWCSEGNRTSWEATWRITGDRGSIVWDGGDSITAQVIDGDTGFFRDLRDLPVPDYNGPKVGGHLGLLQEFVACVENGTAPETRAADNINSLAMVFGAIRSAQGRQRVLINRRR